MKLCSICDEPIPDGRLRLFPDTDLCAPCKEETGDDPRYLGIREKVGTKHLGGCDGDIIKSKEQIQKFHEWRRKQKNRYPQ